MKKAWSTLVHWFEFGDLVPLIVIVSAVHYSLMLQAYDHAVVAVAIGLLVDLGHFRTVRAAVRYSGASRRTAATRWLMALAMTAVAVAYQQRYYGDWWLSLPLPFLIASLAWLQHVDRATSGRSERSATAASVVKPIVTVAERAALPEPKRVERVKCETCGRSFSSQQACNAHQRVHSELEPALPVERITSNGNGHK